MSPPSLALVRPTAAHLPSYVAALQRGWSADTIRGKSAADEELARIAADPAAFLEAMDDPEARGPPVTLPDGSKVPRIPGLRRWIWVGDDDAAIDGFAGSIGLRWPHPGQDMPPHVLGHIGYAVVPWKEGRGLATAALGLLLPEARARGLAFVDITTDTTNVASQRVIEKNGGVRVERFTKPAVYGSTPGLRYRITL